MKCPRCKFPLFRTQFEGVNVQQCGKCLGNLIMPDRLIRLAATTSFTATEIMNKWRSYPPPELSSEENQSQICRCPTCRVVMEKCVKFGGIKVDLHTCNTCQHAWLDAGEIELYQLAYLVSAKGQEAQQFKDMHQQMTPQEQAQLQSLINRLPDDVGEPRFGGPPDPFSGML